jgi:ABC-2 type transport system ATP-binding protein
MIQQLIDETSHAINVSKLSYRYGRTHALRNLDLVVPHGAFYALLGPNGSGKTTLLQLLAGIRHASEGRAEVLGKDSTHLDPADRMRIGYVAEGQQLPNWMRLGEFEAYLAPMYSSWDRALANQLRHRFDLDSKQKLGAMSRGQYMKAALLCALAPRPSLLLLDEPFTGIDVRVKDELVRGLLDSISGEGWTVVLSSHDIGELEMLADWVGFLDHGCMQLSEPIDSLRARYARIDVIASSDVPMSRLPVHWMSVEHSARRLSFVVDNADVTPHQSIRAVLGDVTVESREVTLRELFIALAGRRERADSLEKAS